MIEELLVPTPKKKKKTAPAMLLNEKVPLPHRRMLLADICNTDSEEATAMLDALFKAAAQGTDPEGYALALSTRKR